MNIAVNEFIGFIGSLCLGICALPQVIKTIKTGKTEDLSGMFLFLWFFGEIAALSYSCNIGAQPLIWNYLLNLLFIIILIVYKTAGERK